MATPPDFADLPRAWQPRFEFFHAYGPTSTPQGREAYRALPFGAKMRIGTNVLAFLFGPIYFFVKGVWRKGLTLLGIGVALGVLAYGVELPELVDRAINFVVPAIAMTTANYAYYLQVTRNSESWNPFEGQGRRTT
ncbi:DUF2628 domain-containing protein [Mycobacterium manitobense]|uniref:DUF2628 domain-containing protein n=1 Tax=[Mycobacterium] manitobense TaxID=190147 RepID=A0A9X2YMC9_9MYCO|nr:DUF2628 domain-containing protein [[Mycobacterium] manitobense]MCV7170780.1 DUF2628 domain-containing protein [[Mycobacterium] manitobense]